MDPTTDGPLLSGGAARRPPLWRDVRVLRWGFQLAVLAVVMDPTSGNPTGNQGAIPIANIQVITKSGKTFTLFDPDSRPIAPNGNSPGEARPEAPASPASEPPK